MITVNSFFVSNHPMIQISMKFFLLLLIVALTSSLPHPHPHLEEEGSGNTEIKEHGVHLDIEKIGREISEHGGDPAIEKIDRDDQEKDTGDSIFKEIHRLFGQIGRGLVGLVRIKAKLFHTILEKKAKFVASFASSLPHPAPQSEIENSIDTRIVNTDLSDEKSDTYDQESRSDANLGEILGLFGQIGSGLVGLAQEKGKLIHSVLGDKKLRERVNNLVRLGVNGTQQLIRASAPVVQQIPKLFSNTGKLAGNVAKAADETAPLFRETLQEYGNQAPLLSGIARSYAEINIENAQNVVKAFQESLRCNTQCGGFEEGELKEECKELHCKPTDEDPEE